MDDYVPLGPDETIRENDIFDTPNRTFVMPVIGSKASDYLGLRLKRPRSTVIRDAAIALLRDAYILDDTTGGAYDDVYIDVNLHLAEALREAIGISVEDLRKQA